MYKKHSLYSTQEVVILNRMNQQYVNSTNIKVLTITISSLTTNSANTTAPLYYALSTDSRQIRATIFFHIIVSQSRSKYNNWKRERGRKAESSAEEKTEPTPF